MLELEFESELAFECEGGVEFDCVFMFGLE